MVFLVALFGDSVFLNTLGLGLEPLVLLLEERAEAESISNQHLWVCSSEDLVDVAICRAFLRALEAVDLVVIREVLERWLRTCLIWCLQLDA